MMDIRFHNNKEFMAAHRDEYISKVRMPYYALIEALTPAMLSIDKEMEVRPARVLSRIFRDTRFSRDKSPYRDHHWIAFRHAGIPREAAPMFWMEIRVERVSWGLGFWGENKEAMEIIRRRIIACPEEFEKLNRLLKRNKFSLEGDTYKRVKPPDGMPPALCDWYTRKELLIVKQDIESGVIFGAGFADVLARDFTALKPVYRLMQGSYELSLNGGNDNGL